MERAEGVWRVSRLGVSQEHKNNGNITRLLHHLYSKQDNVVHIKEQERPTLSFEIEIKVTILKIPPEPNLTPEGPIATLSQTLLIIDEKSLTITVTSSDSR